MSHFCIFHAIDVWNKISIYLQPLFKGHIHHISKEIFINFWRKYSSVFSAPIWPVHIFVHFLSDHSHTSHSSHFIWTRVFKVKVTFSASSFSFEFPFNRYSNCTKSRLEFIQPIILFLVQSIGKYQIPRELTMILLFGIKMWTRKGGRSKKMRLKIGHNSVEDNWREF